MPTPAAPAKPDPAPEEALKAEVEALRLANGALRLENARLRLQVANNGAGFEKEIAGRAAIEAGLRTQLASFRGSEAQSAAAEVKAIEERQAKPAG